MTNASVSQTIRQVNGKTIFVACPECSDRIIARIVKQNVCPTCGDSGTVPERTSFEYYLRKHGGDKHIQSTN